MEASLMVSEKRTSLMVSEKRTLALEVGDLNRALKLP